MYEIFTFVVYITQNSKWLSHIIYIFYVNILKLIVEKLYLLHTPPRQLLTRFLSELGKQQRNADLEVSAGRQCTLQLNTGYLIDKQAVEVSIVQAKNLPGRGEVAITFVWGEGVSMCGGGGGGGGRLMD